MNSRYLKDKLRKHNCISRIYHSVMNNILVLKLRNVVTYQKLKYNNLRLINKYSKENIILFLGVPHHSNAGDQAQSMCTLKWLERSYPDSVVIQINSDEYNRIYKKYSSFLKKLITEKNIIFIQSGYNTTDIYLNEEIMHRNVIQQFPSNTIVILPQTVNFKSEKEELITKEIYNKHEKLIFFARDEISFKKAKTLLHKIPVYLYPDIVTTLIGSQEYKNERNGVLLCMRNDVEAYFQPESISQLRKSLEQYTSTYITDTTLKISYKKFEKQREKILYSIFDEYSRYKVIITDRYHGTIFSLISGTPVVVLNSADHKLSSGVKWFPEEYKDYVYYANNLEDAKEYALMLLNKNLKYKLREYFNTKYYNKLKRIIEEEK